MDFSFSAEQQTIRSAIERICARFGDDYWLAKDKAGRFPHDFHRAFADDGWLGICIPQEYGGAGLGVTEAALMMQAIAKLGAGMSGASALHMNIFGLNPVVVFGNDEQKRRMLPPLIAGQDKACFAVTEPNVGLETLKLKTKAVREGNDRYVMSGQKIWISTAQVATKMLILARTTPLEQVKRRTEGLSLFIRTSTANTSTPAKSRRWGAAPSTPTSCSSTTCRCRWTTGSARRARASNTSCMA